MRFEWNASPSLSTEHAYTESTPLLGGDLKVETKLPLKYLYLINNIKIEI